MPFFGAAAVATLNVKSVSCALEQHNVGRELIARCTLSKDLRFGILKLQPQPLDWKNLAACTYSKQRTWPSINGRISQLIFMPLGVMQNFDFSPMKKYFESKVHLGMGLEVRKRSFATFSPTFLSMT